MSFKYWIALGSLFNFFSVLLGAFGAHSLKNHLSEKALQTFQLGVSYQFMHGFALIIFGLINTQTLLPNLIGNLFICGIIFFSGSLYTLSITQLDFLGWITPLGGLCFLLAWILLTIKLIG